MFNYFCSSWVGHVLEFIVVLISVIDFYHYLNFQFILTTYVNHSPCCILVLCLCIVQSLRFFMINMNICGMDIMLSFMSGMTDTVFPLLHSDKFKFISFVAVEFIVVVLGISPSHFHWFMLNYFAWECFVNKIACCSRIQMAKYFLVGIWFWFL